MQFTDINDLINAEMESFHEHVRHRISKQQFVQVQGRSRNEVRIRIAAAQDTIYKLLRPDDALQVVFLINDNHGCVQIRR